VTKPPPEKVPPQQRPAPAGRAAEALKAYREAQQRLKDGDWAGYGQAMERLEKMLNEMAAPADTP